MKRLVAVTSMTRIWVSTLTCAMLVPAISGPADREAPDADPPIVEPAVKEPADVDRAQGSAQNNPTEGEMTAKLDEAIAGGFVYLKGEQDSDGSFRSGRYGKHVGITALSALAFMSNGHLPGRGEYGDQVTAALDFVLAHATETGLLAADTSHGPMYGHGFAALFLGEIYGMNPSDKRVRDALVKAVDLLS